MILRGQTHDDVGNTDEILVEVDNWDLNGMYSPWIPTMSSGHDVSEYELDTSGLPPMFHHNNRTKIEDNHDFSN